MRSWLLVILFVAATVAVVLFTRERGPAPRTSGPAESPAQADSDPSGRETPTPLARNRALSELERVLARNDLSRAHVYRQQVCEQLPAILKDEGLTRSLLNAIREQGVESDDPKRRALMLPILRVMRHPEATQLIAEAYAGAKDVEESLILIEAMAHDYHDPKTASVWVIDQALHAGTTQQRERAFQVLHELSKDPALIARTAIEIHGSTQRVKQSLQMISAIVGAANPVPEAREWLRRNMRTAKGRELGAMVEHIDTWGTVRDADALEAIAKDRPEMAEFLLNRAKAIRKALSEAEGPDAGDDAKAAELDKKEKEAERDSR